MRIIVLATVPHTGTWFMVGFLRTHPAVSNFIEIQVLQKAEFLFTDQISGRKGLTFDAVNLVQGHFGYPAHEKLLLAFAAMCPLIIPLRDPLLTLISAVNRDRSETPNPLPSPIKAWLRFVEKVDAERDFYKPCYIALDMPDMSAEITGDIHHDQTIHRSFALEKVAEHCGVLNKHLEPLPGTRHFDPHIKKWADEWPHDQYNSRGMYPLKEAYLARDKKKIRAAMPEAYYFLEQAEAALRPMLEREGYRELMWWS